MSSRPSSMMRVFTALVVLLILKVTAQVVLAYRQYFPPDFASDFLRGREAYFFGPYRWAFLIHICSGPLAILLGLLLISNHFRVRFPGWHRRLGRVKAVNVLTLVSPSGLWMSYYAASGPTAAASFATLSVMTGLSIAMGWKKAVERKFLEHRRWMLRNFTLLCSAVVLRLMGGFGTATGVDNDWYDPVASWACWLIPLGVLEACFAFDLQRRPQRAPRIR
ncbi:DUF2306 domain-containing protein [Planctomicrobium sp. SH661]|uniref:DUF2306 domain-containing protein n=1 Tax=Planctomicrobium sp. SH661 TaxID=3448124 RepID=UPI003F5B14D5